MDFFIIYGLVIISVLITLGAQFFVSSSYKEYSKKKNKKGFDGKSVARIILDKHNLSTVKVQSVSGYLSDHYDPSKKVVRLSEGIYDDTSIASVAVAAHECGHAIQDSENYFFLKLRSLIIPLVNISSYAGYFAIFIGCIFSLTKIIWLGIIFEVVILLFQIITLPVEFNASKRGLEEIKKENFLDESEYDNAKTMLVAAALTYVASVATTLIQILRLILIFGKNDD